MPYFLDSRFTVPLIKLLAFIIAINFAGFVLNLCVQIVCMFLLKAFNPLDPIEISENPSEILGRSQFLTKYGSICYFHNNLFNI